MSKALTTALVAKAGKGVHPDSLVRGLRLHVSKTRKSWVYRYRADKDGKAALAQVVVGHLPAMGLEAARERVRKLQSFYRSFGVSPRAQLDKENERKKEHKQMVERAAYNVGDLITHYGKEHLDRNRAKASAEAFARVVKRLPPKFLTGSASIVTRQQAHGMLVATFEAPQMLRLAGVELKAAWEHAITAGRIDDANPWKRIKLPAPGRRSRTLGDGELATLAGALAAFPPTPRDAIRLLLLTGCRPIEIAHMEWADVDLPRGTYALRATKTDQPRSVQLVPEAVAILEARKHDGRFVFGKKKAASPRTLYNHWVKRKIFEGVTLYDATRRTVRTGLARIGCPHEIGEAILGHALPGVAGRYQHHAYEKEQMEWLRKWAAHMVALQSPEVVPLRRSA